MQNFLDIAYRNLEIFEQCMKDGVALGLGFVLPIVFYAFFIMFLLGLIFSAWEKFKKN